MATGMGEATATMAVPIAGKAFLLEVLSSPFKFQHTAAVFDFQAGSVASGNLNQPPKNPLRTISEQDFGLIIHSRVAVFHIDRIDINNGFAFFKPNAEQERFAASVA